ncbi:MAG: FtsX-like permease family protein, partial [Anaerolineae bacterium]|nr:FtsX-like permease family protein [Anaerolineae bacterium]
AGERVLVEGFEGDVAPWLAPADHFQLPDDLIAAPATGPVVSGAGSLQVDYRIRRVGSGLLEPTLLVNEAPAPVVPLVVSRAFATYQGERSAGRAAYQVGDEDLLDLTLPFGRAQFRFRVVGVVERFPTVPEDASFVIGWLPQLRQVLNGTATLAGFYDLNQAWLALTEREPDPALRAAISLAPGVTDSVYAWDRYNEIQREPLPNAITGMLFAGFWVSLSLSILDFAFYLAVTARRRAVSFAVLQAIGWEARNIWAVLAVEQAALVLPALLVGVLLGAALAYLLLPFLALIGSQALRFPAVGVSLLLLVLVAVFAGLLGVTAVVLRRQRVDQVLRLGEE